MKHLGRYVVRYVLPPLATLVLLITVWHFAVLLLQIKPYFLPAPMDVLRAGLRIRGELGAAAWLTGRAALGGFSLSLIVGSVVALLFALTAWIRLGCYPYAVILQTVPIVAIAPLIVNWFEPGLQSIILVSFIVSVFPIIANATAGLTSVDRSLIELFHLYHATPWQVAYKLRIPNAIPDLVTGARTSSGLSVIGGIVGEFFASYNIQTPGLGFMIPEKIAQLKTDEAFAAVVVASLLGICLFGTVSLLGSTVLTRWCVRR